MVGANMDKFGTLPIEVIDWIDHLSNRERASKTQTEWSANFREASLLRQVGFVLEDTDEHVLLAWQERGDADFAEPYYEMVFCIRKELITARVVLREGS